MTEFIPAKQDFFDRLSALSDVWQTLAQTDKPIVIYGMGDGADKILQQFENYNIQAAAVMASDGFVRGQSFHDFRVQSLTQIEEMWSDFVIVLAFGTQLPDVMANINRIAGKHPLFVPYVPVYGDELFTHDFFCRNRTALEQVYDLWADEQSLRIFRGELEFYLTGSLPVLTSLYTDKDTVFREILQLSDSEDYLDLGAYRGDTIKELLHYTNGYRSITALEPDARTFARLKVYAEHLPNTRLINKGIWHENTTLLFDSRGGRSSTLSRKVGKPVEVTTVDTLFADRSLTYLKADVEGSEYEMLMGAKETLLRCNPKLNIALYHRGGDLFRLPLYLQSLVPKYRFYLRQHPYIPSWDLNLYAV